MWPIKGMKILSNLNESSHKNLLQQGKGKTLEDIFYIEVFIQYYQRGRIAFFYSTQ